MGTFLTCYRREVWKYLTTPLAAAMLIFYLFLSGVLTLTLGGFIDGNSASLDGFFVWQPWLFLFLASGLTMGIWAEEYRTGSAELLLTMPISHRALVWAKFASGMTLLATALLCTAPFPVTCALLGNPDWGPIFTGYLGCLLAGALFLGLGQFASVLTASQFVSFLLSFVTGLVILLAGFRPTNLLLLKWGAPAGIMHFLSTSGLTSHFEELYSGRLSCRAVVFFLAGTAFFLALTALRLRMRHNARGRRGIYCTALCCCVLLGLIPLAAMSPWRLDCTSDGLYTLDSGSLEVLGEMVPVEVTYVYSQNHPEISPVVRRHAMRILEMLREYARHSDGKLRLREFYPESPSEQDQAEGMGLRAQVGSMGDLWFLGVVLNPVQEGTGSKIVIPFFDATESAALEYQLTRAIAATRRTTKRKLGILSTLPVLESFDSAARRVDPTWWSIQQLQEDFQLVDLDENSPLPSDLDALMLVHPKNLSPAFLDSLGSYLDSGRGVLLALDPLSKVEVQRNASMRTAKASDLPACLAERWGVSFVRNRVVADHTLATAMTDPRRGLETILTLLTMRENCLSKDSSVTAHLTSLTFFCSGHFQWQPKDGVAVTPLAQSTQDSSLLQIYEAQRNAADLMTDFKADGNTYPLAIQIQEKSGAKAILVGDADWLHNSLCANPVQDQNGMERFLPINDNGAFLANALEFLCDDSCLQRLRSRGVKPRTFTRLEELGKAAEKRIQELDAESYRLESELRARAMALIQGKSPEDPLVQEELQKLAAEDELQQQQLKERQRGVLFDLRLQLDIIERRVALWNLLLTPALLVLGAAIVAYRRRR